MQWGHMLSHMNLVRSTTLQMHLKVRYSHQCCMVRRCVRCSRLRTSLCRIEVGRPRRLLHNRPKTVEGQPIGHGGGGVCKRYPAR